MKRKLSDEMELEARNREAEGLDDLAEQYREWAKRVRVLERRAVSEDY